jgi:hypothetical protein
MMPEPLRRAGSQALFGVAGFATVVALLVAMAAGAVGFLFAAVHLAWSGLLGPAQAALATGLSAMAVLTAGAGVWRWRQTRRRSPPAPTRPFDAGGAGAGDAVDLLERTVRRLIEASRPRS